MASAMGACKDCRHWHRLGPADLIGDCERIDRHSSGGAFLTNIRSALVTEPGFGCVLFKAKLPRATASEPAHQSKK